MTTHLLSEKTPDHQQFEDQLNMLLNFFEINGIDELSRLMLMIYLIARMYREGGQDLDHCIKAHTKCIKTLWNA